ncbi:universal stress protein [Desulfonema ishimotonii]|uniref:Universal stress protein n=2 Tax=Desulfonema ishimotonii TaxID=45657 RepID=A0A401G0Y9_9BACT|nr:universal stress protein [Desulfonema ishimotonii]
MKEFKKILFPLDLSATSPRLVPYVLTMKEKFDAELHLLFVARDFADLKSIYVPHPSIHKFEDEVVAGGKKKLEEFREDYFETVKDVTLAVLPGDPSQKILEYIRSEGIDCVVIGTHGRRGLEKVFFGSVAERVIGRAEVPVLVVNPYHAA